MPGLWFFIIKRQFLRDVLAYIYNFSTQEAKVGGLRFKTRLGYTVRLYPKGKKKKKKKKKKKQKKTLESRFQIHF
jgi:hypothetical protein